MEEKIEHAKNFCKDPDNIYSLNLLKNLERELCIVLKNIRVVKDKIFKIKTSNEFFEYQEN